MAKKAAQKQDASAPVQEVIPDWPNVRGGEIPQTSLEEKSLDVTSVADLQKKVNDIKVIGNGDLVSLLCKASSADQGWMKSAKAMYIKGVGCVVQFTAQQKNIDGTYTMTDTSCFVPGVKPIDDPDFPGGRKLVIIGYTG